MAKTNRIIGCAKQAHQNTTKENAFDAVTELRSQYTNSATEAHNSLTKENAPDARTKLRSQYINSATEAHQNTTQENAPKPNSKPDTKRKLLAHKSLTQEC